MSASLVGGRAQILLPFAEREYIDLTRTMRILGADNRNTIYALRTPRTDRPFIETVDYGNGRRQRILYASVVRYCDWLRLRYSIPDRRPQLANPDIFRHRDEDLLPFPLQDTIGMPKALAAAGYQSRQPLLDQIEQGSFEAYQLIPDTCSPWRVSRTSFVAWLERCRNRAR